MPTRKSNWQKKTRFSGSSVVRQVSFVWLNYSEFQRNSVDCSLLDVVCFFFVGWKTTKPHTNHETNKDSEQTKKNADSEWNHREHIYHRGALNKHHIRVNIIFNWWNWFAYNGENAKIGICSTQIVAIVCVNSFASAVLLLLSVDLWVYVLSGVAIAERPKLLSRIVKKCGATKKTWTTRHKRLVHLRNYLI